MRIAFQTEVEARRDGAFDPQVARLLDGIEAFDGLSSEDRLVLASRASVESIAGGMVLFREGESDPWMFYLLEGTLELVAGDGRKHRIEIGSASAGQVVSRLKPRRYTASAVGPLKVLRIDSTGMGNWHSAVDRTGFYLEEISDAAVLEDLADEGAEDEKLGLSDFVLPSLPAIALQTKQLIDRGDADVDTIAKVVVNDPSIAAKLIKAGNSPIFYGNATVASTERAIVRLGINTTRQLIMAFAMRELFQVEVPGLAALVTELWDHSTQVAAMAFVLARRTRAIDAEEAQLAGLLHDLGVIPVLTHAAANPERYPNTDVVVAMAARHRATIGARALTSWNFPQSLVDAARNAEDWWRGTLEAPDLTDVVVVAQLLSFIGTNRIVEVPPVIRVPAFARLLGADFDVATTHLLLEEMDEQVAEIRGLLRA